MYVHTYHHYTATFYAPDYSETLAFIANKPYVLWTLVECNDIVN